MVFRNLKITNDSSLKIEGTSGVATKSPKDAFSSQSVQEEFAAISRLIKSGQLKLNKEKSAKKA